MEKVGAKENDRKVLQKVSIQKREFLNLIKRFLKIQQK